MIDSNEVRLLETIKRYEWVLYNWIDVTEVTHTKRHYLRGAERPVSEAVEAGKQWDEHFRAVMCEIEEEARAKTKREER